LVGDFYYLEAITPQEINGYEYAFHHWIHFLPTGEPWTTYYEPLWGISVPPEFDYHRYVAYFTGGPYSAQVVSPDGYEIWHVGEERDIVWDVSIGADSTTLVNIFLDRDGGNGGYPEHLLTDWPAKWGNSFTWTVAGDYSTHCRVKIVAEDVAGNSDEDVSNKDFIISESGNNPPVIDGHIQCKYPYGECYDCIKYGEQVTVEILAHDPDGDSMFYEWWCPITFGGHFSNGQKTMTTAQNYVTYIAPTKGKDEQKQYFRDCIHVTIVDVRGGQSWAEGNPELHDQEYTCLCGDVTDDLVIDLGDLLWYSSYLYKGGAPPPDPTERADINNDCLIDLGDLLYMVSYLYHGGSCPECCWFPPNQ